MTRIGKVGKVYLDDHTGTLRQYYSGCLGSAEEGQS
jgi:hypothetical protein